MRNTDQRLAAVHKKLQRQQRNRTLLRRRMVGGGAVLAAFALVIGAGIAVPEMLARISAGGQGGLGVTASIFVQNGQLGGVVIAVLSFVLGVVVTLLGITLHRRNQRDSEDNDV
ncbi:MAG: hypothetical protein RRY65_06515 [Pseudoflavonifractor sp.]